MAVGFEVVGYEGEGAYVGNEVIDVPFGHFAGYFLCLSPKVLVGTRRGKD